MLVTFFYPFTLLELTYNCGKPATVTWFLPRTYDTSLLFSCTSVCTGRHRRTSPMSSSARLILRLGFGCTSLSHHRRLSVIPSCPPSPVRPFLLPLSVLRAVCVNTSRPYPPCLFSEDA